MTTRPYSKVYHEIVDDPQFERVYFNDAALAEWLRMLLAADAMYPTSAPMPRRNSAVRLLIESGLVLERPGRRYSIRGLEAEREHRSAIGRNAALVRHHSERTANAMPSKAEQSKAEQSKANGAHAPTTTPFMSFRQKASLEDIQRQEEEAWTAKCGECGVVKRKHPSGGDHPFRVEQAVKA